MHMNIPLVGSMCNRDKVEVPVEVLPLWRRDSGSLLAGIFLFCWIVLGLVLVTFARRQRSRHGQIRLA